MAQRTVVQERPDRYELYNLYKVMKLSIREIAARLGYSKSEVARWLQDYNFQAT